MKFILNHEEYTRVTYLSFDDEVNTPITVAINTDTNGSLAQFVWLVESAAELHGIEVIKKNFGEDT